MNIDEKIKAVEKINAVLKEFFPNSKCSLMFGNDAWRLLVMGRLSAQCTDERVNKTCVELFKQIPDVYAMAKAELGEIERLIYPCGLYRTKAKNLKDAATELVTNYDGNVPDTFEELIKLPGVGSKIANLMLGDCFGKGGIVADTHCIRISNRLGLVESKNQNIVERTLDPLLPKSEQSDFCHRLVDFGRSICTAKNPKCNECPMKKDDLCRYGEIS